MTTEIRCAIEYREDDTRQSPGHLTGTLLEYETRAKDRPEMFASGALSWPEGGIILNEQHNRQAPIIRFTPEVRGKEVKIDIPLPDTQRGRDAAVMVKNGTMRGLSIEFNARDEENRAGVRVVKNAVLKAAALVDDGSYSTPVEVREKANTRRRWWR